MHRFDKVLSTIKAGDYLLIQYGHNDQKEKGADALTSYTSIFKKLIDAAKEKGATPVVVTSMNRESFDKEGHITNSFINQSGDYIDAARQVAKDEGVALIDLNALSKTLYEAIGPEHTQPLFANAKEHTHHSNYGSYELAKYHAEASSRTSSALRDSLPMIGKALIPPNPIPRKACT